MVLLLIEKFHLFFNTFWRKNLCRSELKLRNKQNACSKSTVEALEKKCEIYLKLTIKTPKRR